MPAHIIKDTAPWFPMEDKDRCFGQGAEVTSRELGAINANIFRFQPVGPDIIHKHEHTEETYWLTEDSGEVEMWLDGVIHLIQPGTRVIIPPGTWHASRPVYRPEGRIYSEFLIVGSPPFDPENTDQVNYHERPKEWYGEEA